MLPLYIYPVVSGFLIFPVWEFVSDVTLDYRSFFSYSPVYVFPFKDFATGVKGFVLD